MILKLLGLEYKKLIFIGTAILFLFFLVSRVYATHYNGSISINTNNDVYSANIGELDDIYDSQTMNCTEISHGTHSGSSKYILRFLKDGAQNDNYSHFDFIGPLSFETFQWVGAHFNNGNYVGIRIEFEFIVSKPRYKFNTF